MPERNTIESLNRIPIFSSKVFKDGRTFILLGNNRGEPTPFSYLILNPQQTLVLTSFDEQITNWLRHRVPEPNFTPQADRFVAVVDLAKPRDTKIIDMTRQTINLDQTALQSYEKLEGCFEADSADGHDKVPDTELILSQKSGAKEQIKALVQLEMATDNTAPVCDLPTMQEKIYIIPVTDQMVEASLIEGDPSSSNAYLQQPRQLLRKDELLIARIASDGSMQFITPGWGKAKTSADNLATWKPGTEKTIGQLIDEANPDMVFTPPGQQKKTTRISRTEDKVKMARHLALKLIANATDIYPPDSQVGIPQDYNAGNDFESRVSNYPEELRRYLQDHWLQTAVDNQLKNIPRQPDVRQLSGVPEPVIEWILNSAPEEQRINLATYYAVTQDMPRAISGFTRQVGLNYLGQEKAEEMLADIYTSIRKTSTDLSWDQIKTSLKKAPSDTKEPVIIPTEYRSDAAAIAKNLDARASDGETKKEELIRALAAIVFDGEVSKIGLANFSPSLLESATELDYHSVYQLANMEPKAKETFFIVKRLKDTLIGQSQIRAVSTRNMDALAVPPNGNVTLGLELCPLYENINGQTIAEHGKPAPIKNWLEKDILESMVGGKWLATKAVIKNLARALSQKGLNLNVRAIFGDVGVIITKPEYAGQSVLADERLLYERLLKEFCASLGVDLTFTAFSELRQDQQDVRVPQFCLASPDKVVTPPADLNGYIELAGIGSVLSPTGLTERRIKEVTAILADRLTNSKFNPDVFRTLVQTYVFLIQSGMNGVVERTGEQLNVPTMRLGMEIADNFLALTVISPNVVQAKMPALNILVQKPT